MKNLIKKIIGKNTYLKLKHYYRINFPTAEEKVRRIALAEFSQQKKDFYGKFVSPKDLVFDVGANMGNRVETFLSLGAKVIAVEPQDECCKVLNDKFGSKIIIEQMGLAEEEGERTFYKSDGHCVSSFSQEWIDSVKDDRLNNWKWTEDGVMKIGTLDSLIAKYGAPAFVKIDVEGYELNVLQGLSQPLNMISLEYTVPEQTSKAIECVKYLEKLSSDIRFNFSVNEDMVFKNSTWLTGTEMCEFINSEEFIQTSQGDIYAQVIK